ncbi:MAG: GrlR family regulatory protein [Pseudomonadota bacterium]|uniref:GrlR family regulatory protein n=1 Tax=Thermithiobacillus tepidarius TaxID=929 RepID=UPI000428E40D|nr:GrlR family regulatory protein [Thermithiobacillus tepidarius]
MSTTLEGLWSVAFESAFGSEAAAGVLVFDGFRLFGGSAQYHYLGTYHLRDNAAHVCIEITHYDGALYPGFGEERNLIVLASGEPEHAAWSLTGFRRDRPDCAIAIHLTRRADLPRPSRAAP